jgi:peptidyl-prolyl cis-trans isomerase C
MIRSGFIFFILLLTPLTSFSEGQEASSTTSLSPSQSKPADLVVLRISGRPITERQVINMIDDMTRQMKLPFEQLRQRNSLLFKDALSNLVTIALLKDQIQQQSITVDPATIDQQAAKISKQYPSQGAFQKALTAQGLTESELRKNLEESIGLQLVMDAIVKNIPPVSDVEIEKFYTDNPDKFSLPERVRASHILLTVPPGSTTEQKDAIKKRLGIIRTDIEAGTISFADAAAQYSQDPATASKGGDLGTFTHGQMVKPFEEAAFATKPGMLSGAVESTLGYHLIKTTEMKPAGKATLEESKQSIKQHLEQIAKQAAKQKYVQELQSKTKIESFMTEEEFTNRHPVD